VVEEGVPEPFPLPGNGSDGSERYNSGWETRTSRKNSNKSVLLS